LTLIEVNPDNKTASQDRSCEAVGFYYDDITLRGVQNSAICCNGKNFYQAEAPLIYHPLDGDRPR